jgi:hypothetical protein
MFVLCVVSKGKMHDKERSTDEVQSTREYKKKKNLGGGEIFRIL